MIITTTSSLQGYEIVEYLGIAQGIGVNYNSTGMSGKTGAKMWNKAMAEVTASLEANASEMGADAVIGMTYFQEKSMCYVYGTAVKIKKI